MANWIWIAGAAGYYSALIVWIIAQRTRYFHGKYSHSWMIGVLLTLFGAMQIVGSLSDSLIMSTALISLAMPIIVVSIDVDHHRREDRGLFGHKQNCWMESKESSRHDHGRAAITFAAADEEKLEFEVIL